MYRSNFWRNILISRCCWLVPLNQTHGLKSKLSSSDGILLILVSQLRRVHLRPVGSLVENAHFGLVSLDRDDAVGFSPDAVLDHVADEWVWPRLFMLDLHPVRTQPIDLAGIVEPFFLDRPISNLIFGVDGDPALFSRNYLKHRGRLASGGVGVDHVSVVWVVHYAEVRGQVLLVAVVFRA